MGFLSKLFGKSAPDSGKGVDELARRLATTPEALQKIPLDYRELRLPKKDGTPRILHAPADPLKTLQRTLLRKLLSRLAAHPAAMGFERGHSIVTNAAPHVGASLILKMDLRDFFTRTTATQVRDYFRAIGWNTEAANLLVKLTTHNGGLPQGAPTSPRLSNLLNCKLDARLFALALKFDAVYTRYADDMTFSLRTPDKERMRVASLIRFTKQITKEHGYTLHQDKKLQIRRRHDRMLVTGIVVNQKLDLPRETRRKLRAIRHHLKTGRTATHNESQLKGWDALHQMIITARPQQTP